MSSKEKSNLDLNNLTEFDEKRVKEIFDTDYQTKFIKTFLNDEKFYEQVFDIVVPDYFENYHRILIDNIKSYIEKYGVRPDYNDIKRQVKVNERNSKIKTYLVHLVDLVEESSIRSEKEIQDTAYKFFKKRALANALYNMSNMWQKDDFEGMMKALNDAMKAGEHKQGGLNYFDDIRKTLLDDVRNPVTAMEGLDEETGGGLAPGELGVVMAPTGGGKSMLLVAIGANAMLAGKKVLYISCELREKYIAKRFHACFNNIPQSDLKYFPDVIEEKAEEMKAAGADLMIKEYPTRSASINTLRNYLTQLKRTENFEADVVIIDYADILKVGGSKEEMRLSLQYLYQDLRGLAGEFDIPIWTATQTNRSASKQEFITIDSIAESYGKAAEADLILGLGRGIVGYESGSVSNDENGKPVTLKSRNEATIGILKNRMGEDGVYKYMVFNTSTVQIYIKTNKTNKVIKKGNENKEQEEMKIEEKLDEIEVDNSIANIVEENK